jgi:hypothetical protein
VWNKKLKIKHDKSLSNKFMEIKLFQRAMEHSCGIWFIQTPEEITAIGKKCNYNVISVDKEFVSQIECSNDF